MLKLKVGQNYLLTNYTNKTDQAFYKNLAYTMSCFKGVKQYLLSVESPSRTFRESDCKEVGDLITKNHIDTIFLLSWLDIRSAKKSFYKDIIHKYISNIKVFAPNVKINIVIVNKYENTNKFLFAQHLLDRLSLDPDNILNSLPYLEQYKRFSKRGQQIPQELKIVENDIKKLSKEKGVCTYVTTLKSLEYLHLIKEAEIIGSDLSLKLYSLPIYPSEPLGLVYSKQDFINNPYLYKAAEYIYQGCTFKAPETRISINSGFRLRFGESIDKRFDTLFHMNNWSGVGYPHFGDRGFCAGEFNDAIAHGKEYGLGYYLVALKQYLTTANMRDLAGARVWWYPIYDKEDNLVYCAGLDALIEERIKDLEPELYDRLLNRTWEEKATILEGHSFDYTSVMNYSPANYTYSIKRSTDGFLELLQERDKDVYKKIMKGDGNKNE